MSEPSNNVAGVASAQVDFDQLTKLVSSEFQVKDALIEQGVPTFHLVQPQETKQAFLRVLKSLESANLVALLRREEGQVVLRIVSKPPVKRSNVLINWGLFLATIATTFFAGYLASPQVINPYIGGATFTVAMLAVLGVHEMGHKITANRKGIDATMPYFIPGLPPLGTFGAVIMQKSLPSNRDALFDIGADGPIAGFIVATIVSIIGLTLTVPSPPVPAGTIGVPVIWNLIEPLLNGLNLIPKAPLNGVLLLHPVAFAGWVGMLVTTLNLLPAAMLDGGHVARSVFGEKPLERALRLGLAIVSIAYLTFEGLIPMALLVLVMLFFKHPGPLDDVSSLSRKRKLAAIGLVVMFILCAVPLQPIFG